MDPTDPPSSKLPLKIKPSSVQALIQFFIFSSSADSEEFLICKLCLNRVLLALTFHPFADIRQSPRCAKTQLMYINSNSKLNNIVKPYRVPYSHRPRKQKYLLHLPQGLSVSRRRVPSLKGIALPVCFVMK